MPDSLSNPSSALLYFVSGVGKLYAGMFAEAKSDILHAIQLSPRDPSLGLWLNALASSDIGLGHFDDAINESNRALEAGNRTFLAYASLATAYAMTNRIEEAKAAIVEALKLNPKLTVKFMSERNSKTSALAEGLRKAGLPEELKRAEARRGTVKAPSTGAPNAVMRCSLWRRRVATTVSTTGWGRPLKKFLKKKTHKCAKLGLAFLLSQKSNSCDR